MRHRRAAMRHRREPLPLTIRQTWTQRAITIGAALYALLGLVQLGVGRWQGLVSLACGAAWLGLAHLLLYVYRVTSDDGLVPPYADHDDDDPHCLCQWCEDARAEGYGADVN